MGIHVMVEMQIDVYSRKFPDRLEATSRILPSTLYCRYCIHTVVELCRARFPVAILDRFSSSFCGVGASSGCCTDQWLTSDLPDDRRRRALLAHEGRLRPPRMGWEG